MLLCLAFASPSARAGTGAGIAAEAAASPPLEIDELAPGHAPQSRRLCPVPAAAPAVCSLGDRLAQACPPPPRCRQDERPCYIRRDNGCMTWRCCKR